MLSISQGRFSYWLLLIQPRPSMLTAHCANTARTNIIIFALYTKATIAPKLSAMPGDIIAVYFPQKQTMKGC